MNDIVASCVKATEKMLGDHMHHMPPRESNEPLGPPALHIDVTSTPIFAVLSLRDRDLHIVGQMEFEAHRIPKDVIQNVRWFLESMLSKMNEDAARSMIEAGDLAVLVDCHSRRVALCGDDIMTTPAPAPPEVDPPSRNALD